MNENENENNDLYLILNVSKNATINDIKISYKKLIIENHPDKNMDSPNIDQYKIKFIKIREAYEVLSNEKKRKLYDLSINNYGKCDEKMMIKIKSENIFNFIKNPLFYLILIDKFMHSDYNFINNFLVDANILKILDIEQTIEFSIHEYYNNIPKFCEFKRLTRNTFDEHIFAIDMLQVYENEGEMLKINNEDIHGNFIVNIKINKMSYKKINYYIFENDLMIFINNKCIKNNKIKIKFLDDKHYTFEINKLKKAENLIDHCLNFNKNEYSNIYYIENIGLPYFENTQEMSHIDLQNVKRGNLFFILII
jgi:curved DNA-binding protein CbpA